MTVQPGATPSDEKDSDGSFRVPSYRGVWVNKIGKHFIKLNGERYTESKKLILFGSVDSAAKKHDELKLCDENVDKMMELNFKPDGSRIVYDDNSPASASGMGGSVANVVPALSVINIKVSMPFPAVNCLYVVNLTIEQTNLTTSCHRIYHQMLSHYYEILDKHLAQEEILSATFTLIEEFAAKHVKATTGGRVKFHLWVSITIWVHLTGIVNSVLELYVNYQLNAYELVFHLFFALANGMRRLYTVSF